MRQEAVVFEEQALDFADISGGFSRAYAVTERDRRSRSHRFAQRAASTHDASRTHGKVSHRDIAPGKEQIADIFEYRQR